MSFVTESVTRSQFAQWVTWLCFVLVFVGAASRFVSLDAKPYWFDEVVTSTRIAGFTEREIEQRLIARGPFALPDLALYQGPNAERDVVATVRGLAVEEPQLPPLYFVTARLWVQAWGNSIASRRALTAVASLLFLPALFWLCRELFGRTLVTPVAVALAAVSPFHLAFAQEARPYAFWALATVLSSAALLQALRRDTAGTWALYGATVALSLYTYLLAALVVAAHGIFVVLQARVVDGSRQDRLWRNYLLAAGAGTLATVPWLMVVARGLRAVDDKAGWTLMNVPLRWLMEMWVRKASMPFVDFHEVSGPRLAGALYLAGALFVAWAAYGLARRPSRSTLFVLLLIWSTAGPLLLIDVIATGRLTSMSRYLTPSLIGVQLAVAYLFATRIAAPDGRRRVQWIGGLLIVLAAGVASSVTYLRAPTWWTKGLYIWHLQVAEVVNRHPGALLIAENPYDAMSLAYLLEPGVRVQLVDDPESFEPAPGFRQVYVYDPSDDLRATLARSYRLGAQLEENWLWRLTGRRP